MKRQALSDQIAGTYKMLRLGLAVLAFIFPPLLWLGGHTLGHLPLAGSMSAYYHASDPDHPDEGAPGAGVMRNEFVGILFAVGALLFAYQGYSRLEDQALNLAAVFAVGVALFPMKWPANSDPSGFSLHGTFAILFFVSISYVCIWRAADTLPLIPNASIRKRYLRTYQTLGWAMVLLPLLTWALVSGTSIGGSVVFFVEVTGIYVFATYWIIKGYEASQTNLDGRAALGELCVKSHGLSDILRPLPLSTVNEQEAHE